jgi:probable addiction module antidote protein
MGLEKLIWRNHTRIPLKSCICEDTLSRKSIGGRMPVSKEKADLKNRFRDNPEAIASYLSESLSKNELGPVLQALNQLLVGQNVMAVAREAGMRRDKLYRTFGGKVDPTLGRVLALLGALNVALVAVPRPPRPAPTRPKLGRPRKKKLPEAHKQPDP